MPDLTTLIGGAFAFTVGALVVLHVWVYAAPLSLVRFNALPWAFRIEFNTDLDFQTVTYAAVHSRWPARWTHLTLPLEYVAWNALLWAWHPAALVACTLGVLAILVRVEEKPFAWLAMACAVGLAVGSAQLMDHVGAPVLTTPLQALLLTGPALRFLGHAFDPIPPWVGVEGDAFVPLRQAKMGWRLPLIVLAGWLSEAAASLPFRLLWVQLFWLAQRLRYRPRTLRPWSEASALGREILRHGWRAFPKVGKLFDAVVARS